MEVQNILGTNFYVHRVVLTVTAKAPTGATVDSVPDNQVAIVMVGGGGGGGQHHGAGGGGGGGLMHTILYGFGD